MGTETKKSVSDCCGATIDGDLADGVLTGTCSKCGRYVCRHNPYTGKVEMLHGEPPWGPFEGAPKESA